MEKLRLTQKQIIYIGPGCHYEEVVKAYPSKVVEQNSIIRIVDASYFKTRNALKTKSKEELVEYETRIMGKFVNEALRFLRDDYNLILTRLDKELLPKFFAFIPGGKLHALIYRDNPADIIQDTRENGDDKFFISAESATKDFERAKSFTLAERIVWLPRGLNAIDVIEVSGDFDRTGKTQNTKDIKDNEEAERERQIIKKGTEEDDGLEE